MYAIIGVMTTSFINIGTSVTDIYSFLHLLPWKNCLCRFDKLMIDCRTQ
jgi:hypothetical protein